MAYQTETIKGGDYVLSNFVDKLLALQENKIHTINGQTYTEKELERVPPHVDRPKSFRVTGLDSVCKMIQKEIDQLNVGIFVQVTAFNQVEVWTTYLEDFSRNCLYDVDCDVPGFREGFKEQEKMIIQLKSLFAPSKEVDYLLDLLSRMTKESGVTSTDNGVTQVVEAKKGISLKEQVTIKPRVVLKPFRTFLEVEQPESEFIVRINEEGEIGLFEADGGVWKLEAKRNIAAYFEERLKYEKYFNRYSCLLTGEWILEPMHEIGEHCPLQFSSEVGASEGREEK